MIALKRFLSMLLRVQPAVPENTMVRFVWGKDDREIYLVSVEYKPETNIWTVKLRS